MTRRTTASPLPLFRLFDRHAASYYAWFKKSPGSLQFPGEVAALQLLMAGLPRPWLEVGTGTGRFAGALGVQVGLDPSRKMLLHGKGLGVALVQGTGSQLPFRDETIGGVSLVTTLCFVAEPNPVLREARRVLQPAGGLLLADILKGSTWGNRYQELGRRGHRLYRYARFYSLREMEDLLIDAGFQVAQRSCSVLQPPQRVTQKERGWWGFSQQASFGALLARKMG